MREFFKEGYRMGKYLNAGNEDFRAIRKTTYVDKTGLISFINNTLDSKQNFVCVSRPRRFGKSFAARMLCAYYCKNCRSKKLFEDLEIAGDESFMLHLNKYNVIYFDVTYFISLVSDINDVVGVMEEEINSELLKAFPAVEKTDKLSMTLFNIADSTGEKFFMIIDEWDAIFREAKNNDDLQKKYITFLRGLFKSNFTARMFHGVYMTGILPIKKYGTESAMTDFKEYSVLAPGKLAQYAGFTEPEVKKLCEKSGMPFEEIKEWYDGYSFDDVQPVYNPYSVMEAVYDRHIGSYWTKTGTYKTLQSYIDMDEDGLKEAVALMLGGGHVRIDTETFQNDMVSIQCRDDVLTLLVHLGYLAYSLKEQSVYIPNKEIKEEFIRAVRTGKHKNMLENF